MVYQLRRRGTKQLSQPLTICFFCFARHKQASHVEPEHVGKFGAAHPFHSEHVKHWVFTTATATILDCGRGGGALPRLGYEVHYSCERRPNGQLAVNLSSPDWRQTVPAEIRVAGHEADDSHTALPNEALVE